MNRTQVITNDAAPTGGSELPLIKLLVRSSKGGRGRFAGVVVGVALGMALLLLLLSAGIGIGEREKRGNWFQLSTYSNEDWRDITAKPLQAGEFAAGESEDIYLNNKITVVQVAFGPNSPTEIPGMAELPKDKLVPGAVAVSPAVAKLLDADPQLAERYGPLVGTLGKDALEGPDSYLVVILESEQKISAGYYSILTNFKGQAFDSMAYQMVAVLGAIAVLIPVALLISLASSLGAVQRAERFATLRLLGATPAQVGKIAAAESGAAAALGAIIGIALYFAVIPLAAQFQVHNTRFFWDDLMLNPLWIIVAAAAVVGVSTLTSFYRTVKADLGPLGNVREQAEKPVRATGVIMLVVGMVGLLIMYKLPDIEGLQNLYQIQFVLLIASFLAIVAGLLSAGPLITKWLAKLGSRIAGDAAGVIAFNHMERHPRRVFNSVAGIVLATYLVTLFSYGISAANYGIVQDLNDPNKIYQTLLYLNSDGADKVDINEISAIPGVSAVAIADLNIDNCATLRTPDARALGFKVAGDGPYATLPNSWPYDPLLPSGVETIAEFVPAEYGGQILLVKTDGRPQSIEQARTAMNKSLPASTMYAKTPTEALQMGRQTSTKEFANLAYIGILVTVALSTLVIVVSVITSLINRKRQFTLLKLTGMRRKVVSHITYLETLIPLAGVFIISIGLGIFTAWGLIEGVSTVHKIGAAPPEYYVVLAVCVLLAVLASAATSGVARRMLAGNQVPRYE